MWDPSGSCTSLALAGQRLAMSDGCPLRAKVARSRDSQAFRAGRAKCSCNTIAKPPWVIRPCSPTSAGPHGARTQSRYNGTSRKVGPPSRGGPTWASLSETRMETRGESHRVDSSSRTRLTRVSERRGHMCRSARGTYLETPRCPDPLTNTAAKSPSLKRKAHPRPCSTPPACRKTT
jgi:hypothetical protein